jgi:hypothetical protein
MSQRLHFRMNFYQLNYCELNFCQLNFRQFQYCEADSGWVTSLL